MFNHTGSLLLQTMLYLAQTDNITFPANYTDSANNVTLEGDNVGVKCYGEYGCFSVTGLWEDRPANAFPEHPEKVNPQYCLHTRTNKDECQWLYHKDPNSIYESNLIPSMPTYFVTHGFLEGGQRSWLKEISNQILSRNEANVILIDWEGGSSPPYTQAVANIRLVGRITAHLINTLRKELGLNVANVHLIGHSLGSHLSGYVGSILQTNFGITLGRITGLDPAEPHFSQTDPMIRLDPSDALYVDIIHTDSQPFIKGGELGLGMSQPIGHLDFYPNGGENQPGCDQGMMNYINSENGSFYQGMRRFLACNHVRAHEFFTESIKPSCNFIAIECDSYEDFLKGECFSCYSESNPEGRICAEMGMRSTGHWKRHAPMIAAGDANTMPHLRLFTITSETAPFCVNLYRVTITLADSQASRDHGGEIGNFVLQLEGSKSKSKMINVFKEQYFKPGSVHRRVFGSTFADSIKSVLLLWNHSTTMNILTWRFEAPVVYIESLVIEKFNSGQK
ncbi:pancreatic triacylglycerol lipase-like isoform X1 [Daktulosphaira vitifoliae]|uniref:pancreatic triacylglycerol lipase-like isoform X1 n=2 Tax=Daktulosphaira vitifoliae TaxID=58002 RepID=UPI0021AA5D50|nr:pancreatic triacylglycerol lipase-like isoform X1 [Daktulosphaira vitifoliae]